MNKATEREILRKTAYQRLKRIFNDLSKEAEEWMPERDDVARLTLELMAEAMVNLKTEFLSSKD